MKLAIVGATGAVGREVLACLSRMNLPLKDIVLLASPRSAGTVLSTPLGERTVQVLSAESFAGIDYAIFSAGASVSKSWAQAAMERGCTVVDNSSSFRYDPSVPLVIPSINGARAVGAPLIANPNCTTAIAAMAVWPLHQAFGVEAMLVSTYQSASGAGAGGMAELIAETQRFCSSAADTDPEGCMRGLQCSVFAHPLPFNLIPCIDAVQENDYTKEEMKVNWETKKIFADDSLKISCTCVRVPVLRVHCETIVLKTRRSVSPAQARAVLQTAPGIEVRDDARQNLYPLPRTATGKFAVEVGRMRQNLVFGDYGLEFFVAGDQLLRGAALNALEIIQYCTGHVR